MDASQDPVSIEQEETPVVRSPSSGKGGIYLVVADDTEEFLVAMRYATRLAESNHGHVAIAHVTSLDECQHWGNVESMMRRELRTQAEKFVWDVAKKIADLGGRLPISYILEGTRNEVLVELINGEPNIVMLILGGGTGSSGPGPLVSYFSTKGLAKLRVPVVLVSGNLDPERIDALV